MLESEISIFIILQLIVLSWILNQNKINLRTFSAYAWRSKRDRFVGSLVQLWEVSTQSRWLLYLWPKPWENGTGVVKPPPPNL